jgi:arsenate reductase (glutaredoxin)
MLWMRTDRSDLLRTGARRLAGLRSIRIPIAPPPEGRTNASGGTTRSTQHAALLVMEVQIFGHKKDPDTRKALRFFAERRVKTHFVDFAERAAAPGELKRFAQKFGVQALVDREGKRFAERGLGVARYGDERWLELMVDDPGLVRTPLVRFQHKLTVGLQEAEWKQWCGK